MQEDNLYVDVLAIFVQEILEKVRDRFVGDVAAHNNMSVNTTNRLEIPFGRETRVCAIY